MSVQLWNPRPEELLMHSDGHHQIEPADSHHVSSLGSIGAEPSCLMIATMNRLEALFYVRHPKSFLSWSLAAASRGLRVVLDTKVRRANSNSSQKFPAAFSMTGSARRSRH